MVTTITLEAQKNDLTLFSLFIKVERYIGNQVEMGYRAT